MTLYNTKNMMPKCRKCHLRETKFEKFPGGRGMPLDPPRGSHLWHKILFILPVGYVGDSIVNYPGTIFVSRITLQNDTFPSQKARKCISESLISKHF